MSTPRYAALPIALTLALLAACTPSRTYVLDAPPMVNDMPPVDHRAVTLREDPSTVQIPDELRTHFRQELAEALAEDKPQLPVADPPAPADLTLSYRFILLTKGNAPVRIGSGLLNLLGSPFYGLGDGAVGLEVAFLDPAGRPIGRIVSDGPIAGIFGNQKDAAKTAAQSIAKYVKMNYTLLYPPEEREGYDENKKAADNSSSAQRPPCASWPSPASTATNTQ